MTAQPLAPEADLAHVLDLAKIALRTGTMIDPETLLCDLLGLDEAQLQDWLDQLPPIRTLDPSHRHTAPPDQPPDQSGPASARERAGWVRPVDSTGPAHRLHPGMPVALCGYDGAGYAWLPAELTMAQCLTCSTAAKPLRAHVRRWRQAEAGTVQHLVHAGRPLCGSDDAGPWRTVAGAPRCPACAELEDVLANHG